MSEGLDEHLRKVFATIFPDNECPGDPSLAIDCLVAEVVHLRHVCKGVDIRMRPFDQIQRAHDVLVSIWANERLRGIEVDRASRWVIDRIDLLCWVLAHGEETQFGVELKNIEEILRNAGVPVNGYSLHVPKKPN